MKNPWGWIPALSVTQEIPSVTVLFVSLLMLLQIGIPPAQATLYASLLFLPWTCGPLLEACLLRVGHLRACLYGTEFLMFLSLVAVAFSFSLSLGWLMASLMSASLLCVLHETALQLYFQRGLDEWRQRYFRAPKVFFASFSAILTYGGLIILVGVLQVFFRQIRPAWSMGCYCMAGLFFLTVMYNMAVLPSVPPGEKPLREKASVPAFRVSCSLAALFLLLQPYGFLLYSHLLFLMDSAEMGGLGRTIQEVGFLAGTVGGIAFGIGLAGGRWILYHMSSCWSVSACCVSSVLFPCIWLCMALFSPKDFLYLSLAIFFSHLFAGVGLNVCRMVLSASSRVIDRRDSGFLLRRPEVTGCIWIPLALSGWFVRFFGYFRLFLSLSVLLLSVWFVIAAVILVSKRMCRA